MKAGLGGECAGGLVHSAQRGASTVDAEGWGAEAQPFTSTTNPFQHQHRPLRAQEDSETELDVMFGVSTMDPERGGCGSTVNSTPR